MNIRHTLLLAAALVSAAGVAAAATDTVGLIWQDSTYLRAVFPVTAGGEVKSDFRIIAVPSLVSEGDTLQLSSVEFAGKRNRKYNDRAAVLRREERAAVHTPQDTVRFDTLVAVEPWMLEGDIALIIERIREGCCRTDSMKAERLAETRYEEPFVPEDVDTVMPILSVADLIAQREPALIPIEQYEPFDKNVPLRRRKGALYIHFHQNKTTIDMDYMGNADVLSRIVDMMERIERDTISKVVRVVIVGQASPEGSVAFNERVAGGRAEALREYITRHVELKDAEYEVINAGEAWADLKDAIEESTVEQLPERDEFLRIIRENPDVNVREQKMRAMGAAFDRLRSMFVDQRNAGYIQVYYEAVPDKGAETINRAVQMVREKRYAEARDLLEPLDDDRKWNTLAVSYYMTGDPDKAMACFERAAADGNAEAQRNIDAIRKLRKE